MKVSAALTPEPYVIELPKKRIRMRSGCSSTQARFSRRASCGSVPHPQTGTPSTLRRQLPRMIWLRGNQRPLRSQTSIATSPSSKPNTIKAIVPHEAGLELYDVHAVTEGTDAQAEVTVRLSHDGSSVTGRGADPDTLVASAKAYLVALNKLIARGGRLHAQAAE